MKEWTIRLVLLFCRAGAVVDAFLPYSSIHRHQTRSSFPPGIITEATIESSSDTTASSPSNDETTTTTGGYVPSGLTSQEYQAIRAKEQQQQQQGTNLGAWGPRFDRGEAPLGDWMVDSNLWINGFVDGVDDDDKSQQVVAPPRVRSVAFVAPPGKKGSLVSVEEAQDWLDYHAEWFGLEEGDENDDEDEEDGIDNLERNVKVAVVDLTGRTWDAKALAILQPGLANIASEVEILHLGNTSCTTSEANAASVMKVWSDIFASSPSSVKEIDLSDNDLSHPQVAKHVGKLLSNSPLLERLYMVNCNLQHQDGDASNNHGSPIWKGILSASKNCRLHELILDANPLAGLRMAQDVAQVLERCPHLHVFSYCGNQPTANGTRVLADALHAMVQQQTSPEKKNHPLAILRLENCALNNEGSVDSLANALASAPNLQRLSLRDSTDKDTTIGKAATQKLLQGLVQANCPLECLDLGTWHTHLSRFDCDKK